MVVKLGHGGASDAALDRMIEKLGELVFDMEALRRGARPEELAGSAPPVLDNWQPRLGTMLYLEGAVTGHPKLVGQDRLISTSELFLLSADSVWARTSSRWYRLGDARKDVFD